MQLQQLVQLRVLWYRLKKAVVEPIEQEEQRFEDNRKKAMRKGRSAHHG